MIELDRLKENLTKDAQALGEKVKSAGSNALAWLKEMRLWLVLGIALALITAALVVAYNRTQKAEKLLAANITALKALQERDTQISTLEAEIARLQAERAEVDRRAEALAAERHRLEAELVKTLARASKPYKPQRTRTLEQSREQIRRMTW